MGSILLSFFFLLSCLKFESLQISHFQQNSAQTDNSTDKVTKKQKRDSVEEYAA